VDTDFLDVYLPVPDDSLGERRQKYVDGLRFRAIVSTAFALMFLFVAKLTGVPYSILGRLLSLVLVLVVVNPVYWLIGQRNKFSLRYFYLHWAIDIVVIALLLYRLGGIDVPYGFLAYVMIVVTSATFLSKHAALIVATGATTATLVMTAVQLSGVLSPPEVLWSFNTSHAGRLAVVTFATGFYYVFAYLAGTLADQLKRANTDLSRAREQIEEQNKALEAKVQERTLQLQSRNAEIEEFVHIVTHDLKNVSVGTTETARRLLSTEETNLGERGKRYVSNLVEDTRRMNEMLVHLLRIFRLEKEERRSKQVDLARMTNEILTAQARRLEAKGIRVSIGSMPTLRTDETQLRHVLTNLVDNAIKYVGDKEKPRIAVDCDSQEKEWVISVEDNGIGINVGQRERIFQLYHRAPEQAVGGVVQQGEGVGLAMSKRIIERWGGTIWVESEAGSGSCFKFTIPRLEP
jgi:signal transduction histidine kinase